MELENVELMLCSSAKDCECVPCPHIKPHKEILEGTNRCKHTFCVKVGTHIDCESYIFERKVVETLTKGDAYET